MRAPQHHSVTQLAPAIHPFVRSGRHAGCAECGQTPVAAVHDWLASPVESAGDAEIQWLVNSGLALDGGQR